MEAGWIEIARALVTATFGVYLLSAGVLGWFARSAVTGLVRLLIAAALMTIEGGVWTDLAGIGLAVVAFLIQRKRAPSVGCGLIWQRQGQGSGHDGLLSRDPDSGESKALPES